MTIKQLRTKTSERRVQINVRVPPKTKRLFDLLTTSHSGSQALEFTRLVEEAIYKENPVALRDENS